jgi:hypothetical protein
MKIWEEIYTIKCFVDVVSRFLGTAESHTVLAMTNISAIQLSQDLLHTDITSRLADFQPQWIDRLEFIQNTTHPPGAAQ